MDIEDEYNIDTITAFPHNKNMMNVHVAVVTFLPDWFTDENQDDNNDDDQQSDCDDSGNDSD